MWPKLWKKQMLCSLQKHFLVYDGKIFAGGGIPFHMGYMEAEGFLTKAYILVILYFKMMQAPQTEACSDETGTFLMKKKI